MLKIIQNKQIHFGHEIDLLQLPEMNRKEVEQCWCG
jgi:hypothetical protein